MKEKKTVLIITDGAEETVRMAAEISAALKGNKVSVKSASDFLGNDILPAEAFFLGCKKPRPDSFAYLSDVLKHINLAGRPCGVFSPGSEKTANYLASLLKDCEAVLCREPLTNSGAETKGWTEKVLSGTF